ncbi:MAG TPA: hypothetical protein VNG51_16685 [Ktedonobacteraceae bacterium]|nr:hypothetical protein [Ktedonobacteraceae bacterium]
MDKENAGDGYGFDGVHTWDAPYCDDPGCWCHTALVYHELVTHPSVTDVELAQAYAFFGVLDS